MFKPSSFVTLITVGLLALANSASADFSYSYGDPSTPLNDGYIVSTSNATIGAQFPVRFWQPISGGGTFGSTTPARITYRFDVGEQIADIALWMNMPTFHWSYSRGHNFLYGSNDGVNWLQMAEITPPAFGSANDLGTVSVPDALKTGTEFWIRADLYSYGSSAPGGGFGTNTAQLSRYDVNGQNTSFSLNIQTVPEPTTASGLGLLAIAGFFRRRRCL